MITIENTTPICNNAMDLDSCLDIMDRFNNLNESSMLSLICTLIDTLSWKYGQDSVAIAETVLTAVKAINSEFGAFDPCM